ncbi:MAG: DUF2892 domain-containing protein [Methanimicrococcus sp.]|nr:DUF2892 domain-containing protein [Methanimicrococcus sp.]MCL2142147.1 DUF2892 domain-containing protein [Methanimicrococcus sp.]
MIWMLLTHFIGLRRSRKSRKSRSASYVPSSKMKPNVGREDRLIHAIIGTVALVLLIIIKKGFIIRYILGLAALVGLLTAYTKYSPVYTLIGENTTKNK